MVICVWICVVGLCVAGKKIINKTEFFFYIELRWLLVLNWIVNIVKTAFEVSWNRQKRTQYGKKPMTRNTTNERKTRTQTYTCTHAYAHTNGVLQHKLRGINVHTHHTHPYTQMLWLCIALHKSIQTTFQRIRGLLPKGKVSIYLSVCLSAYIQMGEKASAQCWHFSCTSDC